MQLGTNMKRLLEMDVAEPVKACVIAGPGDLMVWEVCVCMDGDGVPVEFIGRGSDLELAAAAVLAALTQTNSTLGARTPDGSSTIRLEADRAS